MAKAEKYPACARFITVANHKSGDLPRRVKVNNVGETVTADLSECFPGRVFVRRTARIARELSGRYLLLCERFFCCENCRKKGG